MLSFWNDSVAIAMRWGAPVAQAPGGLHDHSAVTEQPVGVGASGVATVGEGNTGLPRQEATSEVKQNFSIIFFFLSFVLLTLDLLNRWIISKHIPLSNLYESLLFLNWSFIAIFFFFTRNDLQAAAAKLRMVGGQTVPQQRQGPAERASPQLRQRLRAGYAPPQATPQSVSENWQVLLGPLLSSTVLFIQSFADWRLPDEMKEILPLIPALQSNWLLMHVSIMILRYAALFLGSILSITYVGANWYLENNRETRTSPPLQQSLSELVLVQLDSLRYRILAFAFPLLTLGILSGAIWANEAWGSYWSWDPKETWAFITWLIFAFYLHTRLQYNWQGTKSALVASFGFFIVWICYLGVNLLGQGLHSYGWLH